MLKRILSLALLLCLMVTAACAEVQIPDVKGLYQYEIPQNEAMAFVKEMKIGWNLGNTFDATRDGYKGNDLEIERYWCGVYTTEQMIDAVHQAGFNTLRLPVSWHNHVDENFVINTPWLDRVQEVVDWAIERGMYVILNTHHDNAKAYYYPDEEHYAVSEKYVTSIWSQVAERFKDYDQHLIFESLNEPRLVGTDVEWWFNSNDARCKEAADCLNRLNQAFVDTVRAAGGSNADRYLMVPAYCASPDSAFATDYFHLPEDTVENHIIVSAHAYTPYSFALDAAGTDSFSVTNISQVTEINTFLNKLYSKYVSKGVPVVIGEFGARAKKDNLQDRVDFASYYIAAASARNIPCCWWDNNGFTGNGELFGIFNRQKMEWPFPEIVEGMMQYAGYDKIPVKE